MQVFTGIPFAAPPVGPLRFRPPQPVKPWTVTLVADKPIPNCIQFGGHNPREQSEDCLYLNVWVPPAASGDRPLPVMVWIFGSGLYTNGPQDYDGSSLASHGVVLVTINHRLGLFGLMVDRSLDEPGALSGNYALRDVQASLRWVQRNIAAFGGDPRNVTVFGDSAGARLSVAQLLSPASQGLVSKVIGESVGGMDSAGWRGGMVVERREAIQEAASKAVIKAVGCDGSADVAECLRSTPASAFVNSGLGPTPIPLVVDPELLPIEPNEAFRTGHFAHVPVMIGTGLNEGAFQIVPDEVALGRKLRAGDLPGLYAKYFGDRGSKVAAGYPVSRFDAPDLSITAARTDVWQACPTDFMLRAMSKYTPVYGYEVTARDLAQPWPGRDVTNIPNSASHGSEVKYVFGGEQGVRLGGRDAALSDRFQRYWTSFARSGSPAQDWPRFSEARPVVFGISDQPAVSLDYAERHNCSYLRSNGLVRY